MFSGDLCANHIFRSRTPNVHPFWVNRSIFICLVFEIVLNFSTVVIRSSLSVLDAISLFSYERATVDEHIRRKHVEYKKMKTTITFFFKTTLRFEQWLSTSFSIIYSAHVLRVKKKIWVGIDGSLNKKYFTYSVVLTVFYRCGKVTISFKFQTIVTVQWSITHVSGDIYMYSDIVRSFRSDSCSLF